jgi:acyl-CoA synthetase (AMP-forming)/AMP-acid ligase II/1-acyl-sn-glycerol-3-phosphate acyltransferase/acyl carrier protein
MINSLVETICRLLLALRYRIVLRGADKIAERGTSGILFLPNHPALIDPVILVTHLHNRFAPRALADKDQVSRPVVRWLARRMGVWAMPDIRKHGVAVRPEVEAVIHDAIADLNRGGNLVLYPSGHSYRTRHEDLRGNSAVETILRQAPDARVVLVRTRGLWGSSFGYAGGVPDVRAAVRRGVFSVLANFIFFTPKRPVDIELYEPTDLPREAGRNAINEYLERFYNQDAPPNTYVPYTVWEETQQMTLPEPEPVKLIGSAEEVPESTRQIVRGYLRELTGVAEPKDEDRLAYDLGMDSLARADLLVWLEKEFGFPGGDVDSLQSVGDVILAAGGQGVVAEQKGLKPVPPKWFRSRERNQGRPQAPRIVLPDGETITEVFLAQAARDPNRAVVADQISGVKTYRDMVLGIMALRPTLQNLEGERVGIMLPASVASSVVYMACLFAGKTPVFVNWTTGSRNVVAAMNMLGVQRILTAGPLVARVEAQGTDFSAIKDRLVLMEEVGSSLSKIDKLSALARSRLSWASLRSAKVSPTAAILLTSGSEAQPKAVPLTHGNLLSNLRTTLSFVRLYEDDCMIGFLPPFHSFGLSVAILLPVLGGARVVYHANPTEAWMLCRITEAYQANLLVGTPTFLAGIIRASRPGQLASLRLAVTGAEKCPARTYAAIAERCPNATIIEGYGITECSPIVAANNPDDPRPYTIGKVIPSLEYVIVDEESGQPARTDQPGMLLVRGPSIFSGYLNPDVASPFVEYGGKQYYRTGDLVSQDAEGVVTFRGRLKRFVKIGGEMISLPAIEAALEPHYVSDSDEGPVIAVESGGSEGHVELVLFATRPVERQAVNRQIRDAGLSALHNIGRVVQLETIPTLGTGKTDYRTLKTLIA